MNKIIDLTHPLKENMPVYPGTISPKFTPTGSIKTDGYRELLLKIQSHTGTHVDAPSHILEKGKTLSDYQPCHFCGTAYVMPHTTENPLTVDNLQKHVDKLKNADFLILHTAWDKFWGSDYYFKAFPTPEKCVVESLTDLNLKGIGTDAISIDSVDSHDLPNHHKVLSKDMIIIENLTNLSGLVYQSFEFFCFPLHIAAGDGSPVRAIARLKD